MTLALLEEGKTVSSVKLAGEKTPPDSAQFVVTAPDGKVCAEKISLVAASRKILGWVEGTRSVGSAIAEFIQRVEDLAGLQPDWNGYGSQAPNAQARKNAIDLLLSATGVIVPNRIGPSGQGGIGICFYVRNKYADIECLNSGEILAATSDGTGRPDVWEVEARDGKGALERIVQFINS